MNTKQTLYFKLNLLTKQCIKFAVIAPLLVSCNSSKTPGESKPFFEYLNSRSEPKVELEEDEVVVSVPQNPREAFEDEDERDDEEEIEIAIVGDDGEMMEINGKQESIKEYVNQEGEQGVEVIVRTEDDKLIKIKGKEIATPAEELEEEFEDDHGSLYETLYEMELDDSFEEEREYETEVIPAENALIHTYQEPTHSQPQALSQQRSTLAADPNAQLIPQPVPVDPEVQQMLNEQFKEEVIPNSENVNDIKISMNLNHAPYFLRRADASAYEEQYQSIGKVFGSIGDEILIKKPIDLCERRDVLYVKMHNHSSLSSDYFEDSVMSTLAKNDFFDRTVTRQPTVFINVDPPEMGKELEGEDNLWYDKDDPLTFGQIKKLYPEEDLMILEVRLQEFSDYEPIALTANFIDGNDGTTVLIWRSPRSVWYRAEDMQAAKVMGDFNDWLEDVAEICEGEYEA